MSIPSRSFARIVTLLGVLALPSPTAAAEQPLTVRRLAGWLGGASWMDGPGSVARFRGPQGVAADADGFVYVADTFTQTIRKISPAGVVTTLAGSPYQQGASDGTGSAARFYCPIGVAVGPEGNLYVTDGCTHVVRRVTPAGAVTTLAGSPGQAGSADGGGDAARFNTPSGVAVDAAGNLYVSDTGNKTIRRVTPAGVVSTVAGAVGQGGSDDGAGSAARFGRPFGLALDGSGNLYVADSNLHLIRRMTPAGVVTTVAGGLWDADHVDGPASQARFHAPTGVAVAPSGDVFISDRDGIRRLSATGIVSTVAGRTPWSYRDGVGTAAQFNEPAALTLDGAGNVFVADYRNSAIRKVTPGGVVTTLAGSPSLPGWAEGSGSTARFNSPAGVSADGAGNVYVADSRNGRIRKVSPSGLATTLAGGSLGTVDGTGSAAGFSWPYGSAVDSAGNVYVADGTTIRKVSPGGVVTTLAGLANAPGSADGSGSAARFGRATGVAVDGAGIVYVADAGGYTIRKVTPAGDVGTLAGAGYPGSEDGTRTAARFGSPASVAVDSSGNVYVADQAASTIRRVSPSGVVTTLAGKPYQQGSEDGTGSAARFRLELGWDDQGGPLGQPPGIAVDGLGNVLVTDVGNHTVRKVTPAGEVTTVVGAATQIGSHDGTGSAARLSYPCGVAADSRGTVYIADTGGHNIRTASTSPWGCVADATHLCLLGGRFRVSASWQDYSGGLGTGKAVTLTEDTGYFWFFDAQNVEVVAKMVSFCDGGTGNVGVYANGLTDLKVDLTVEDLAGAAPSKTYANPLGNRFRLIRDGAFPCAAAGARAGDDGRESSGTGGALSGDGPDEREIPDRPRLPGGIPAPYLAWEPGEVPVAADSPRGREPLGQRTEDPASTCTADAQSLCLLNGRYRVTADYRDYGGGSGPGRAVPLTADTGYFWFFDAKNVEVVAKLVSFCSGSAGNVGVYANGLTDLEVNVHVTDTVTQQQVTYTNRLGNPFELIREGPFGCP